MLTVGVDIGGTNIGIGIVDDDHRVRARAKQPTPQGGPDETVEVIVDAIREATGGEEIAAVGVGIPGAVRDGQVVRTPNLPGWEAPLEFAGPLGAALGVPVALGNDVDVGLLGEFVAGTAREGRNVMGVWLGTGIGGALILEGRPYHGSGGAAGEFGHMTIDPNGPLCSCGHRGCIEAYAGRRSMTAAARAIADSGRATSLFAIQHHEHKERATSKVWARALDDGDEVATELFDGAVEALGIGLASVANLLDATQGAGGGGMDEKLGDPLAERIEEATRPWLFHANPDLRFAVSALGDDAGTVGAAALARAEVLTS